MASNNSTSSSGPGAASETMELHLASGNGPITRTVLRTPLRDALPSEIPLIDISLLFSSSLADRKSVARKIHDAASNIGFFYINNHGILFENINNAYNACLDFFRQDMDTKMKADANENPFDSGYRGPGTQRVNPTEGVDVRETYSMLYDPEIDPTVAEPAKIPEAAAKYMLLGKRPWENTENLPHFKNAFVPYFQACLVLARALTRAFALSLDLDENAFDSKVQYPDASLEVNFYPPIIKGKDVLTPSDPDARVSIGSHTDFLLFTILWQDNNGGLQVLNHEGQWIGARPMEGTFVVNIGDYLQRITNDKYVSTVHRAQNWSGRERVSMPFFWGFGLHESCEVLDSCVNGAGKKYEEIRCIDWVSRRLGNLFDLTDEKPCAV